MSSLIDQATIKHRRDTASNWTSNNPTLSEGEWGYETDTGYLKIGDGSTAWTSLSYQPTNADVDAKLTGSTDQLCKAWGSFTGTGTVAIRDGYNFATLVDSGTGNYDVTFTTNMANANYAILVTRDRADQNATAVVEASSITVSGFTIRTGSASGGAAEDAGSVFFAVFST